MPAIRLANSSPDLELRLEIHAVLLGLGRRKVLTASCLRHRIPIEDPMVGCPQCNAEKPGLDAILQALEKRM